MKQISEQSNLKRIRILYEINGGLMIIGSAIAAGVYVWLGRAWIAPIPMLVWFSYMLCAFSYRYGVQYVFRKKTGEESFSWRKWERLYALGLFLTATGWGFSDWILAADAPLDVRYILAFIVVGLCTAGSSNYAVSRPAIFAVMLPMVLPFSANLIFLGHEVGIALGILILILMVLLMSASFRRRDFTLHAWELADEKQVLNQALVDTQSKATQSAKMAALGQMAAGIAHEINTPLAIISACAQTLQDLETTELTDQEMVKALSEQIEATATRIAKIVSGLRTFSRQDHKDPARHFDVGDMIESTLDLCRERFKGAGITLNVAPITGSYRVNGHATQLSQVLLNLLNNAADATEGLSNRWVTIDVQMTLDKKLSIRVTDAGQGIPAELHAKLMEPFFTTKEVGKGTGLGLSVAHGIMVAHQGTLTLDVENPNTCFVMQLPLAA